MCVCECTQCVCLQKREKEEGNEGEGEKVKGQTAKGNRPYLISSRLTDSEIPFPDPGIQNADAGQGI